MRFLQFSMLIGYLFISPTVFSQNVDQSQLGAWYMYMWSAEDTAKELGFQGDIQHRNWKTTGDLEQLLIRGGLTWRPQGSAVKYTLGYAHITSGRFGPSSDTSEENRIYQEALFDQTLGDKLFLTHRFRLEQRWVQNQDYRSRIRYFLGANYPLNQDNLSEGAIYLAFYNELFVNFELDGRPEQDYFDRNRIYAALGYSVRDNLRLQAGYMWQENRIFGKGQLQFNLIQSF